MLPESTEQEPNDALKDLSTLSLPLLVNGKLEKRGDVDSFACELAEGETLVAALEANSALGSGIDCILQIVDPQGFTLAWNHDARGLDPLVAFTAPKAGRYCIRLFGFPAQPNSSIEFAGAENYLYRLTLTSGPLLDHAQPLAIQRGSPTAVRLRGWNLPEDSPLIEATASESSAELLLFTAAAGTARVAVVEHPVVSEDSESKLLTAPVVVSGGLDEPGEADAYGFHAAKGEKLNFALQALTLGFPLDGVLEIVDSTGKTVIENDDGARDVRDPALLFTAPAEGEYEVRVRDLHNRGGMRFAYLLKLAAPEPRFELSLAAGVFTLPAGGTVEIPITVNRVAGFAEEIEVSAAELPAGVTAEPVVSQAKGESAKLVKLKLTAGEGAASGVVRIAGRVADSEKSEIARFPLPVAGSTHSAVWLTVKPK